MLLFLVGSAGTGCRGGFASRPVSPSCLVIFLSVCFLCLVKRLLIVYCLSYRFMNRMSDLEYILGGSQIKLESFNDIEQDIFTDLILRPRFSDEEVIILRENLFHLLRCFPIMGCLERLVLSQLRPESYDSSNIHKFIILRQLLGKITRIKEQYNSLFLPNYDFGKVVQVELISGLRQEISDAVENLSDDGYTAILEKGATAYLGVDYTWYSFKFP